MEVGLKNSQSDSLKHNKIGYKWVFFMKRKTKQKTKIILLDYGTLTTFCKAKTPHSDVNLFLISWVVSSPKSTTQHFFPNLDDKVGSFAKWLAKVNLGSWPLVILVIIPYLYLWSHHFEGGRRKEIKREGVKDQKQGGTQEIKAWKSRIRVKQTDRFTQPLGVQTLKQEKHSRGLQMWVIAATGKKI